MSSSISDRAAIALSLTFGLVGGGIIGSNRGWALGLITGVLIAGAVHVSIALTSALLARTATERPAPVTRRRMSVAQAEEFTARCRQALVDLPVHDPGVRATASVLRELVDNASGTVHEHQVTELILDDLRSATNQLERLDPESSAADLERRLRYIKQSLQETIGVAQKLLDHSRSGG
ncbi:hypothetical protein ACQPZU_08135 [Saccharomonospora azurea]|uniref:hypothetical protein n=1 Tax=Saccharomonospora azurea TaxID=40988 RepID=UPI0005634221|nr:hypothetical protein [Saccharomonospora azurea]